MNINSKKIFNITFFLIYIIAETSIGIYNKYLFSILIAIIILLYLYYTKKRYEHYRQYFQRKKSLFYLIIENGTLLLGIIYVLLINNIFYKGTNQFDLLYTISIVIFLIPSFFGHERLKSKSMVVVL